jgi:HlyD family secretion protein
MNKKNLIILAILVLALLAAAGWWWQSQAQAASNGSVFEATGTIETRKVSLAPEIGGKVTGVMVEEGQSVKAGEVLVRLDATALQTQETQAEAALRAAQANLALLKAGPRQAQVQAAQAALAQAEANLRAAEDSLSDATTGTPPGQLAALRANLEGARAHYRSIRITLTNDQMDAFRAAQTSASGNLSAATGRWDQLVKDNRNPDFVIASAKAAIDDAQSAFDAAQKSYEAASDETRPYYLQADLARESLEVAQANLSMADARHNGLEDEPRSTADGVEAAKSAHEDAQKQVDAAQAAYDALTSGIDLPHLSAAWNEVQQAQSELAAAASGGQGTASRTTISVGTLLDQVDAATAAKDLAAANLAQVKDGTRQEQIDAAQAQVDAVQAQVDALKVQLDKLIITAPSDGVVLARSVEPGEVVMPGASLLEIGRLDTLELTVYMPEDQLGRVSPGANVTVKVDAYPDRSFTGTVMHLADEAEFTPTNMQTKEDRARMVYAVKIKLDNPDLALKPGMISDVEFKQ